MTSSEIFGAVKAFPNGTAADFDALRPQHLKDMLGALRDDPSNHLCLPLAALVSLTLRGMIPAKICPCIYSAQLIALSKKDGGIRVIAVGQIFTPNLN